MKSKKLKSLERLERGFSAKTNPSHPLCRNRNTSHFLKWRQISDLYSEHPKKEASYNDNDTSNLEVPRC